MPDGFAPGTRLGVYKIVERVGAGGMGDVYRGRDTRLSRDVAIKVLREQGATEKTARRRLLNEARAASALNHPHICTLYEAVDSDQGAFIVMEFVEGRTLDRVIPPGGLEVRRLEAIATDLADALAHAHERGVLHRDLKSANVIVTKEGWVKVLDFGLATRPSTPEDMERSQSTANPGEIAGTVPYMAPEVLRGEPADARSDLWALGVLLYEMATGTLPFTGTTTFEVISRILEGNPPPLPQRLPPALRRIIERCLSRDPRQRYQQAAEITDALGQVAAKGAGGVDLRGPTKLALGAALVAGVGLLAWLAGVRATTWLERLGRGNAKPIDSLVVMPLENLSGDPSRDYFADGMTEALITDLSRVRALRVISRASAMRYKTITKSIPEVARELNVGAVVTGSVLHVGDRVRVSAQLIDAAQDRHIWADSYERDAQDVLRLQSELARAIVDEIRVALTPEEEARLARAGPVKPKAHEAYLKGRFHWNRRTEEGIRRAKEFFTAALAMDPTYAAAHAGLALCHVIESDYGSTAPRDSLPKAQAAARRALELDPASSEAHATLGLSMVNLDLDWVAAEGQFRRAIQLNPNDANAHHWYALLLGQQGRIDEAMRTMTRAQQLDPLALIINTELAWLYHVQGLDDAAQAELLKASDIDANFWFAAVLSGRVYERRGELERAGRAFETAVAASGRHPLTLSALGHFYGVIGNRTAAHEILNELEALSKTRYVSAYQQAAVYAGLGDSDNALRALREFYDQRGGYWLMWLKFDPWFLPLHGRPEFRELIRLLKLPDDFPSQAAQVEERRGCRL